jgi:predicted AlkP superfamily pyrophosphatase or phosphodiesterase
VLSLDPSLSTVRLYFGGQYRTRAYPSAFATELAAAGIFWPGPPDSAALAAAERGGEGIDTATWAEQTERFAGFFGAALRLSVEHPDWDLMLGYIPVIDEAGHELLLLDARQAGYTAERRSAYARTRLRVWQAVDRELRRIVGVTDLKRTTVVVVSDHGMAPVHTALDANALLREQGLSTRATVAPNGGMAHLYLASGTGRDEASGEALIPRLTRLFQGWRIGGEAPVERILTREEAAGVGLDSPNSGDLILFAREGYAFVSRSPAAAGAASPPSFPSPLLGAHGYLNTYPNMHAIYMALGAEIAPGTAAGTLKTTDVAPRVASWLKLEPPRDRPAAAPER